MKVVTFKKTDVLNAGSGGVKGVQITAPEGCERVHNSKGLDRT